MRRAAVLLAASAVAVFAGGGSPGAELPGPPATRVVEMRDFAFVPERVELSVGDTVVWFNRDGAPHTATDSLARWGSEDLATGEQWRWVAGAPGVYRVLCLYHPAMRGLLVVRGDSRSGGAVIGGSGVTKGH